MAKILIADDERSICDVFSELVRRAGHVPVVASSGDEALQLAARENPSVAFLDVRMPGRDGIEVLAVLRERHPRLPVIIMTAHGTVDTAMRAMQLGAFDYLGKPVELQRVRKLLERALHVPGGDSAASTGANELPPAKQLVGQSPAMQEVFKFMGLLTANDLTVLITGESGVGKAMVARGIHDHGARRDRPFVTVSCSTTPRDLLEIELFGQVHDAYGGNRPERAGKLEAAADGTFFLDDVAELPLDLQGKLLKTLQEKQLERTGSVTPVPLTARIIAATDRALSHEVEGGRFREDLYHRLRLVNLHVPPLRERGGDIDLLSRYFLRLSGTELGREVTDIEEAALARLRDYDWPGNVQELENVIRRAALLAPGNIVTVHDVDLEESASIPLERHFDGSDAALRHAAVAALRQVCEAPAATHGARGPYQYLVGIVEQALVEEALRTTDGNQVAAARLLGVHRTTLRNKLNES